MPRNFGHRARDRREEARSYWTGGPPDHDPNWPLYVAGFGVAAMILIAVFIA